MLVDETLVLINEVRLTFNALAALVDDVHPETELSAPRRAVLEYLVRSGDAAVPTIARERGVTRQHIQAIVNDLVGAGLLEQRFNPAHRRSPLITLTDRGRRLIDTAIERERDYLADHLGGLDEDRVRAAAATLADLRARCTGGA